MQRTCIRCLSTSARSFIAQQAASSSSSSTGFRLPEHLEKTPIIPKLNHVEPKLRELLQRPLQAVAVYYGNDPADVFDGKALSRDNDDGELSKSQFSDVLSSLNPSSSSSSSSRQPSTAFPPALQKVDKTIDIPLLEDPLITFLTNLMMKDGKKARARRHVADCLYTLRLRSSALPMQQLREAIRLAAPSVRMTSQKKGSKQVQVPIALGERQRVRRAITWILEASDKRNGTSEGNSKKFGVRVAYEIEAILQGRSSVLEKKDKLHKDAIVGRSNIAMGRR